MSCVYHLYLLLFVLVIYVEVAVDLSNTDLYFLIFLQNFEVLVRLLLITFLIVQYFLIYFLFSQNFWPCEYIVLSSYGSKIVSDDE